MVVGQVSAVSKPRLEFATQVSADTLASILAIARKEGGELQALIEEALADLIDKRERTLPRPHVIAAYMGSHFQYSESFKRLAS